VEEKEVSVKLEKKEFGATLDKSGSKDS